MIPSGNGHFIGLIAVPRTVTAFYKWIHNVGGKDITVDLGPP